MSQPTLEDMRRVYSGDRRGVQLHENDYNSINAAMREVNKPGRHWIRQRRRRWPFCSHFSRTDYSASSVRYTCHQMADEADDCVGQHELHGLGAGARHGVHIGDVRRFYAWIESDYTMKLLDSLTPGKYVMQLAKKKTWVGFGSDTSAFFRSTLVGRFWWGMWWNYIYISWDLDSLSSEIDEKRRGLLLPSLLVNKQKMKIRYRTLRLHWFFHTIRWGL